MLPHCRPWMRQERAGCRIEIGAKLRTEMDRLVQGSVRVRAFSDRGLRPAYSSSCRSRDNGSDGKKASYLFPTSPALLGLPPPLSRPLHL
ncbi:rCG56205 [Rattus norvegicus]|uniref:RCG56205 n=1 Tax=Rattus norvegicus TaxID=10116 RepID=A6IAN9_RAT|nr:rCG56205 [Rattus norvegicus]